MNTMEKKKIRVVYMECPLRGDRRMKEAELEEGSRVLDTALSVFPKIVLWGAHFAIDGRECSPDEIIPEGASLVSVWRVPKAGAATAIGAWIAANWVAVAAYAVITTAAGITANILSREKKTKYNKTESDTSEQNYGWNYDSSNAENEGAPVPVLYGRRQVIPPVCWRNVHVDNNTSDEYLETAYIVADSGAGMEDEITFPKNDDGTYRAKIDHNDYRNYNTAASTAQLGDNVAPSGTFATGSSVSISGLADGDLSTIVLQWGNRNSNNIVFDLGDFGLHLSRISISGGEYKVSKRSVGRDHTEYKCPNIVPVIEGYNASAKKWETLPSTFTPPSQNQTVSRLDIFVSSTRAYGKFRFRNNTYEDDYDFPLAEVEIYGDASASSNPIGTYAYIETKGQNDNSPLSFQSKTNGTVSVGKELETERFTMATTAKGAPDTIGIRLHWAGGLFKLNSDGGMASASVKITGQFRSVLKDGTKGVWQTFFNAEHDCELGSVASGIITITNKSSEAFSLQFYRTPVKPENLSHYEVALNYTEEPPVKINYTNKTSWESLYEEWDFALSYPDSVIAGTRLMAGERLNTSDPQFAITAERAFVYVYDSVSGAWVKKSASNPAWACWDMIVQARLYFDSATGKMVVKRERFSHEMMIFSEFAAWADFCDDEGIEIAMYFDAQSDIVSGLEYLTTAGRGALVNKGGRIGVVFDCSAGSSPTPLYTFDETNIVKDTWKMTTKADEEIPTCVEVTYFDKDRDYDRFTVVAYDESYYREDVAQNTKSITLYAVCDRTVAQKFANYYIKANLIRRTIEWTGDLDSMPCEIGDLVKVKGVLCTISGTSFDEEMRRRFTAQEYVSARFA